MTKFGLYGNDRGANNVLNGIQEAIENENQPFFRVDDEINTRISDQRVKSLAQCDCLLLGISGDMPEAEVAQRVLIENPQLAGKIFFIEDFPGSTGVKNDMLRGVGKDVQLLSILPLSKDAKEHTVYRKVHTVGYPDHWVESMRQIREGERLRREGHIQKRVRGQEAEQPLDADDVLLYVSGSKEPAAEAAILRELFSLQLPDKNIIVQFRAHPGEANKQELAEAIKKRDAELENEQEISSSEIIDVGQFTECRLIGAADITIAHPGTTANYLVAPTRKKMICVMQFVSEQDAKTSAYDYRKTERNTHLVESVSDVPGAITALLDDDSPESKALLQRQEQNALPIPERRMHSKSVLQVITQCLQQS